jgi:hypothetical protein
MRVTRLSRTIRASKLRINPITIYTDSVTPDVFDPSWTFSDASVMTVDWGDGTPIEFHATGLSHVYAAAGRKTVKFYCPAWDKLTIFDVNADVCVLGLPSFMACTSLIELHIELNSFTGILSGLSDCYNLFWFSAQNNNFSGVIPSFAGCPNLWLFNMNNSNLMSGTIPSFASCTNLRFWYLQNALLNDYIAGGFATQIGMTNLVLTNNFLVVTAVDAILHDLVLSLAIPGRVVCSVDLSGVGNAPPSNPVGLADRALLVAAWGAGNVLTN